MGHNPKVNSEKKAKSDPRRTKQWNLHYSVDHKEFSHMLTSINWWSSQKEKNHT